MHPIHREDIRIADRVVRLDIDSASAFVRVRSDTFEPKAFFTLGPRQPEDVVRMAVKVLGDDCPIDILIDNKLSVAEFSAKKFGTGWSIEKKDDLIEVCVNDLFASHMVTLCIDSTVVSEAAHLLRQSGVRMGRIFYACPNKNFRYAVFCPLQNENSAQSLLDETRVSFSVELPRFLEGIASSTILPRPSVVADTVEKDRLDAQSLQSMTVRTVGGAATDLDCYPQKSNLPDIAFADNGAQGGRTASVTDMSSLLHPAAAKPLRTALLPFMPASEAPPAPELATKKPQSAPLQNATSPEPTSMPLKPKSRAVERLDYIPEEPLVPASAASPVPDTISFAQEVEFDAYLIIMLDEKVESAIAAAAFLSQVASGSQTIVEIGLWRRKLKGPLGRFFEINDVFELTDFPASSGTLGELSAFLGGLDRGTPNMRPIIVIGEEMLDKRSVDDFRGVLESTFERLWLIVCGESDEAFAVHLSELSSFIDSASNLDLVFGGASSADLAAKFGDRAAMRRFHLPFNLKQNLLVAEKKGNALPRVRELAPQILAL
jgi:hypothetical protein